MSSCPTGCALKEAINLRILPFNSAAAFLVNVIATVSVGSRPGHSLRDVLSLDGHLIAPMPCNGILGADGKILVAL
jgi:hypothetical protein